MPVMEQFPADGPEKCGLSTSVWPQKSDHASWCVNRKGDMIQDLPSAETEGDILNRKKISHFDSAPPFRENQIDQKRCTEKRCEDTHRQFHRSQGLRQYVRSEQQDTSDDPAQKTG